MTIPEQFIRDNIREIRTRAKKGIKQAVGEEQREQWRGVFLRAGEINSAIRDLLESKEAKDVEG